MELMNTDREKAGGKKGKKAKKPDIFELISAATSHEDLEPWEGTLAEYLPMVIENPNYNDTAHARIWRMIESAGIEFDEDDKDRKHPRYSFFRHDLFGIDDTLKRLMEDYFKAAAAGSDVSKRILLLYGPTSSGKSDFTAHIKAGLERFSRTKEGKIFAISNCPMHENPLNAIPKAARSGLKTEYGLVIEGGLCPLCAYRLKEMYGGDWKKLPVERIFLSEDERIGIGTFQPADPKCCALDSLVLTDEGPSRMGSLGSEHEQEIDAGLLQRSGEVEKADRFYLYENQPTKIITTRMGYSIQVTPNHPLALGDEDGTVRWTLAKDLKHGDSLALARGQGLGSAQPTMTEAFAELMGLYVSKGNFSKESSVEISNISPHVHAMVAKAGREMGLEAHSYDKKVVLYSTELVRKMRRMGFPTGAHDKEIPASIMRSGQLVPFMRGLWIGDGNCGRHASKHTNEASYSTVSLRLARQVQIILLALGIPSNLQHEPDAGTAGAYKLVVGEYTNILKTLLSLPDWKLTHPLADDTDHSPNMDFLPNLGVFAKEVCASAKGLSAWHRYTCPEKDHGCHFTGSSLKAFLKEAEAAGADNELLKRGEALLKPGLMFLDIVCIEDGKADVADVRVPTSHAFIANGFVSHNSQDQAELTGSINLSKITEYGSESDPRAFDFNGELNVANRGAMEFIELLKVDPKFRHILLTLAEEKKIKAPRFPLISADLAILSHSNETEYRKFLAQKEEEAIQSRMIVRKFPYNLQVDGEVRIYEKLLLGVPAFSKIHVAPHTLKVAAMFAVLTRLEKPKDERVTLLKKMRAYNGEDVEAMGKDDVKNMKEEAEHEGMEGLDPRYIVNRLSSCFVKHNVDYITPISALRSIEEGLDTNPQVSEADRERYKGFISDVIEEYSKIACNEVQKAFFLHFEQEIRALLNNYIDNALAFLNEEQIENEWGEYEEPDERLMRKVEEKIGITDGGKRSFREEVTRKMLQLKDKNGDYDYKAHARLNEALKKQLFDERSDIIRITVNVRNPDPDALKRLNEVIATLSEHYGYTPESANELLRYVSSVMAKSE